MNVHDLKIELVSMDELERHPDNANNADMGALEESILVNGFYAPLIVQASTNFILAGNHRWEAALALGAETIPVIYLDVTDEQAARIMVADNRTTRLGNDDPALLVQLLHDISVTPDGLDGTGYSASDLQFLIEAIDEPLTYPAAEPELTNEHSTLPSEYEVTVLASSDGYCREFLVTDAQSRVFSPQDLNRLRAKLGLTKLTSEELVYELELWGE